MNKVKTISAYFQIVDFITKKGEIPFELSLYSLTPLERKILKILQIGKYSSDALEDLNKPKSFNNKSLAIYIINHRLGIKQWNEIRTDEDIQFTVKLTSHDWKWFLLTRQKYLCLLRQNIDTTVTPYLEKMRLQGKLALIIQEIEENLAHLAPLVVFVGDQIYSSESYWGNNLLSRRNSKGAILSKLSRSTLHSWSDADKQFVFAIQILLLSGGIYSLEAMNWMQVDPFTIDEYLSQKAYLYSSVNFLHLPKKFSSLSAPKKAMHINSLEKEVRQEFNLYRIINGSTLNKQIKVFPSSKLEPAQFPEPLVNELKKEFEVATDWNLEFGKFLKQLAISALNTGKIAKLLLLFVRSGLQETKSDFFMSRGPRYLYIPKNYQTLSKNDFYCVVVNREGFCPESHGLNKYSANEICWHQSLRMQFNSWKFWYGCLNRDERSAGQYWFAPPSMPDVAYNEHTLHKGHTENGVVQSIRSPASLNLGDISSKQKRVFEGVYDTRAVRSTSHPIYNKREFLMTIYHQKWVGIILQSLADFCYEQGKKEYIDDFRRDFFFKT